VGPEDAGLSAVSDVRREDHVREAGKLGAGNLFMSTNNVQALLFDVGGVVVDFDFRRAFSDWSSVSELSPEAMAAAFSFDDPYRRHERGQIDAAEYFAHLRGQLRLRADDARIAQGWNAIFIAEVEATRRLVESARRHFPCHAFTNTNHVHQAAWTSLFPAVATAFDRIFVSSEIGHRKPDRAAFEHVGAALGLPPASILFFDDLVENVDGARAAGLQGVHVRDPGDVRAALIDLGVTLD
jgi:glucose-1-phosphatase